MTGREALRRGAHRRRPPTWVIVAVNAVMVAAVLAVFGVLFVIFLNLGWIQ